MMPEQPQPQQARTANEPKRLPLVTQPENRSTSYLKDSRLVNCYAEKTSDGYWIEKRPGTAVYSPSTNFFAAGGQGMFLWVQQADPNTVSPLNTITLIISGNHVYKLAFTQTPSAHIVVDSLGTITPPTVRSGLCRFCTVPNTNPYLVFSCGWGQPTYWIQASSTSPTAITDSNFPSITVPGIVYLDGTTYVMDNKSNIWGSANLNDPTVWSALNVIQAENEPDQPVFLAKQLTYVVAIKSTTTQFFYDAGNSTGSPLSPVPGALMTYGCLSADTVQEIDGLLLWVTSSKTQASQVILLEALQPRIVSTPAIDRFMDLGQFASYLSVSFKHMGHRLYLLSNLTNNISLVYDIDQKLWYQWTDVNGNCFPYIAVTNDPTGVRIVQQYVSGQVSLFDADYVYPTDSGAVVPVDIYTPNFDAGVDRIKYLSQMRFNADQVGGSNLLVRASDDDYQTWSAYRYVDLGQQTPILNDEGSFYRRAYNFRQEAAFPFRIKSVDLQMDIGTL
jgi:hypothetical protein